MALVHPRGAMTNWRKILRGAFRMSLIWGAGWFMVGMGIELVHNIWPNPVGRMVDIWPAALGLPAFASGMAFSTLLGIIGRRRKFSELSLPGFTALGAAGGVVASLFPAAMVASGLASINAPYTVWQVTTSLMGPVALLGAASAAGTLMMARRAESEAFPSATETPATGRFTDHDALEVRSGTGEVLPHRSPKSTVHRAIPR